MNINEAVNELCGMCPTAKVHNEETGETRPTAEVVREIVSGLDELLRLQAFEHDMLESIRHAASEECASGEKHCTCVPYLREQIAWLRQDLRCVLDCGMDKKWAAENDLWITRAGEAAEEARPTSVTELATRHGIDVDQCSGTDVDALTGKRTCNE